MIAAPHHIQIAPVCKQMRLRLYCLLMSGLLLPGWCLAQLSVGQSYLSFDIDNVLDLGASLELVDDGLLSWSVSEGYGVENLLTDGRHADLSGISVFNSVISFTVDTTIKILDGSPENNFLIILRCSHYFMMYYTLQTYFIHYFVSLN